MMIGTALDPERRHDRRAHLTMLGQRRVMLGAHRPQFVRRLADIAAVEVMGQLVEVGACLPICARIWRSSINVRALRSFAAARNARRRDAHAHSRQAMPAAAPRPRPPSRNAGVQRVVSQADRGCIDPPPAEMPSLPPGRPASHGAADCCADPEERSCRARQPVRPRHRAAPPIADAWRRGVRSCVCTP